MAEDTPDDEKTEEPTARRLQKAREDGQVPRSQELGVAAVMISSMSALYLMGGWLVGNLADLFASGFIIERREIYSENLGMVQFRRYWERIIFPNHSTVSPHFLCCNSRILSDGGIEFCLESDNPEGL